MSILPAQGVSCQHHDLEFPNTVIELIRTAIKLIFHSIYLFMILNVNVCWFSQYQWRHPARKYEVSKKDKESFPTKKRVGILQSYLKLGNMLHVPIYRLRPICP